MPALNELTHVEGFRELDKVLGELPQAFRRSVVLSALRKAARPMIKDARARALRGSNPRKRGSKKQRDSGEAETIGHGADSIRVKAMRATSKNEATVAIGPSAKHWYMSFVEFGTSRQSPRPFLRPAFQVHRQRMIQTFGIELGKSIERKAATLARQAAAGKLSRSSARALAG